MHPAATCPQAALPIHARVRPRCSLTLDPLKPRVPWRVGVDHLRRRGCCGAGHAGRMELKKRRPAPGATAARAALGRGGGCRARQSRGIRHAEAGDARSGAHLAQAWVRPACPAQRAWLVQQQRPLWPAASLRRQLPPAEAMQGFSISCLRRDGCSWNANHGLLAWPSQTLTTAPRRVTRHHNGLSCNWMLSRWLLRYLGRSPSADLVTPVRGRDRVIACILTRLEKIAK